jgi:prevent-host-death family protein
MVWKLEDAKNRFSELVRRARREGPQFVTRHGREAAVVLDIDEYRALIEDDRGLLAFLRESPFGEAIRRGDLNLERSDDFGRNVEI